MVQQQGVVVVDGDCRSGTTSTAAGTNPNAKLLLDTPSPKEDLVAIASLHQDKDTTAASWLLDFRSSTSSNSSSSSGTSAIQQQQPRG